MTQVIIIVIATGAIIYGLVDLIFSLSGINKKHNIAIERLNINFIKTLADTRKQFSQFGVIGLEPTIVTYFVPCYSGIYNKLRGNIKLCLFTHEYTVTEPKIDKSRQFLIISKEKMFFMELKGWIGTTDRKEAVKAIRYLKEMVSLP